ncbi:PREDICTED: probable carboxylesterase 120 [Erythranthe guttata]|uniref:probable carboxylesterase 120 n=1 Tax=Erythranthe guttata TaxID=4155 RepID=UPI00064DF75E|nr:PREDICTED: probable carboxylesterase 120 [Erythranthe guttata]|eukprot:XP_012828510.1 PREDICTED: probable carboxylesterase 120 [Erythranthe guttata]
MVPSHVGRNFFPPAPPILIPNLQSPASTFTNEDSSLYLPSLKNFPAPNSKLPLVIYYHKGGFILSSGETIMFHAFYYLLKSPIKSRCWLSLSITTTDEWLTNNADFCNYFMMGSNTDRNIMYQSL